MKWNDLNLGHKFQVIWILIGSTFQLWIGGIKGIVVMVTGLILFHINSLKINDLIHDLPIEKKKSK